MQTALVQASQVASMAAQLKTDGALVVMPSTDEAMARQAMQLAASRADAPGLLLVVMDIERMGLVKVHNLVFKHSQSPWYGYLAQDAFVGRQWLSQAHAALEKTNGSLLGFNDGKWQGQIAAFGLAKRAWVDSLYEGDFFFAGYQSHYADVELTLIARDQGQYAYDPHAVVMEVDWNKDSAGVNLADKSLFKARAQNGFAGRVKSEQLRGLFA
jgi:hypothetical protein